MPARRAEVMTGTDISRSELGVAAYFWARHPPCGQVAAELPAHRHRRGGPGLAQDPRSTSNYWGTAWGRPLHKSRRVVRKRRYPALYLRQRRNLTRSTHRTGLSVWLPSYSDSVYQARSRATAEIGRRPFLVAAKRGKHPPHHSGHNAAP